MRRLLFPPCALVLSCWIASLFAATATAQATPAAPAETPAARESPRSPEFRARVERLIERLGDPKFAEREAAASELRQIGTATRRLLEQAAKSDDREISQRAAAILNGFPKLSHAIVDALGAPIPFARVEVTVAPRSATPPLQANRPSQDPAAMRESHQSDEIGRIPVGEFPSNEYQAWVRVDHPDYGVAQCEVDLIGQRKTVRFPLVRVGSEERARAVSGRIVSSDGRPIVGATLQCNSVRTPGEGLINGTYPRGDVLSDDQGRFAYYLPNENPRRERGDLIPINSRYELGIEAPDDSHFPTAGGFTNAAPAEIRLDRPEKVRRFRWESAAGGFLDSPAQFMNIHVDFLQTRQNEQRRVRIGTFGLAQGRKALDGTYHAIFFDNGKTVQYEPLVVTADSPEELVFRLPPEVTFRGAVVQGVTKQPLPGALVMGWNSTSRNNLALLTPEDWKTLRESPPNPPADHPAAKLLRRFYGLQALARTDAEGRFEIVQRRDQQFYGLLAFDQDFVPFRVHVGGLKPDAARRVDVGVLPLFPAARIVVQPVFEPGQQISVSPNWQLADEPQPDWVDQVRAVQRGSERDFESTHWLTLNEKQPIYVPADLRLRLRFETPYHDQWTPPTIDAVVRLERGASQDLGDLKFSPSLPVVVRVVTRDGKPVEGFAVRRFHRAQNAWSVAHNTDKDGRASFFVQRRSEGKFRVSDLNGPQDVAEAPNLFVDYRVDETAPDKPLTIEVTEAQVTLLRGVPRR